MTFQSSHADLTDTWREKRLADDLPALVAAYAESLPSEVIEAIQTAIKDERVRI